MAKNRDQGYGGGSVEADYRASLKGSWKIDLRSNEPTSTLVLRTWLLLIVLVIPWYYGFVTWQAQSWLIFATLPLPIFIALGMAFSWFKIESRAKIPVLSLLLLAVACLGMVQSARWFHGSTWEPSSVSLQRWMLGESDSVYDKLLSLDAQQAIAFAKSLSAETTPTEKSSLAISVSPERTLLAVGSLAVAAMLSWSACVAFRRPSSHIWLFLCLVFIGVVMSCIGLYQAIGQSIPMMEQIRGGAPFGTFVSRNSAGGFLNVCMAGMVGLIAIAFSKSSRKQIDSRYRIQDDSWIAQTIGKMEDRLANLDSKQVASLVVLVVLASAVFASASRGATISMIAASLATIMVSMRFSKSKASWVIGMLVAALAVTLLVTLEIDTRIRDRFGKVLDDGVARSYIWEVAFRAMQYYLPTGSGLGTFHFAALPFQDTYVNGWFYHAESLILEFFGETGLIGLIIFVVGLVSILRRIAFLQGDKHRNEVMPIVLATTYLTISMLVHDSVDFPLLIPAIFSPAVILLGAFFGVSVHGSSHKNKHFKSIRRHHRKTNDSRNLAEAKSEGRRSKQQPNHRESSSTGPVGLSKASKSEEMEPSQETSLEIEDEMDAVETVPKSAAERTTSSKPSTSRRTLSNLVFYAGLVLTFLLLIIPIRTMQEMGRVENKELVIAFESRKNVDELEESEEKAEATLDDAPWIADATIADSLRMQAESEMTDFRNQLYAKLTETGVAQWNSTDPVLLRAFATRYTQQGKDDDVNQLFGGPDQVEAFQNIGTIYRKARKLSPLDWRLIWGQSLGEWKSPKSDQLRTIAALDVVAANQSRLLLAMGTMVNELGESAFANQIWTVAMGADAALSRLVAGILVEATKDGDIPVKIFPAHLPSLESLANNVFSSEKFPSTHAELWKRIGVEVQALPKADSSRWFWLAKWAREGNDDASELKYIEEALRLQPYNISLRTRLAVLFANTGDFQRSLAELSKCLQSKPGDPGLIDLQKKVRNLLETPTE